MVLEPDRSTEIPLSELYPSSYLNSELRGQLDDYLKTWLNNIEIIRQHNPDEAELVESFMKGALLNLDGYNALDKEDLNKPKAEDQDSFLKEWNHEIKNILALINSIKGVKNLYDFSEIPNINNLDEITNDQRSDLHLQAINGFINILSETNNEKLVHKSRDQVKWWDSGQLTDISLNQLILSALSHINLHFGFLQSKLLSTNGVLPPLYRFAPQLTKKV